MGGHSALSCIFLAFSSCCNLKQQPKMGIQTIKTKTEFDNLLKSSGNLILIDFFATWCGPCRMIAPKLEDFSVQYTDVIFAKVDVDENSETVEFQQCQLSSSTKMEKWSKKLSGHLLPRLG